MAESARCAKLTNFGKNIENVQVEHYDTTHNARLVQEFVFKLKHKNDKPQKNWKSRNQKK